eukprot:9275168-Pyramimonas_sp.AAC.1
MGWAVMPFMGIMGWAVMPFMGIMGWAGMPFGIMGWAGMPFGIMGGTGMLFIIMGWEGMPFGSIGWSWGLSPLAEGLRVTFTCSNNHPDQRGFLMYGALMKGRVHLIRGSLFRGALTMTVPFFKS